jgi:hypothetical protein
LAVFHADILLSTEVSSLRGEVQVKVAGALVLHVDNPDLNNSRVWPDGYTVRPDWKDPTRGRLVRGGQTEEPQPAVPPSLTESRTQRPDADQTE